MCVTFWLWQAFASSLTLAAVFETLITHQHHLHAVKCAVPYAPSVMSCCHIPFRFTQKMQLEFVKEEWKQASGCISWKINSATLKFEGIFASTEFSFFFFPLIVSVISHSTGNYNFVSCLSATICYNVHVFFGFVSSYRTRPRYS